MMTKHTPTWKSLTIAFASLAAAGVLWISMFLGFALIVFPFAPLIPLFIGGIIGWLGERFIRYFAFVCFCIFAGSLLGLWLSRREQPFVGTGIVVGAVVGLGVRFLILWRDQRTAGDMSFSEQRRVHHDALVQRAKTLLSPVELREWNMYEQQLTVFFASPELLSAQQKLKRDPDAHAAWNAIRSLSRRRLISWIGALLGTMILTAGGIASYRWFLTPARLPLVQEWPAPYISALGWSPDGQRIASVEGSTDGNALVVRDAATGEVLQRHAITVPVPEKYCLLFVPDGRLALGVDGQNDFLLSIFDRDGHQQKTETHLAPVCNLRLSNNEVYTGRVPERQDILPTTLTPINRGAKPIATSGISPDGQLFLAVLGSTGGPGYMSQGTAGQLNLWRRQDGKLLASWGSYADMIFAFDPQSTKLATAGEDGIRIWQLPDEQ